MRLADILKLDLSAAQQACPVDLAQVLGNSGYESGLAQWTATKPSKTYQLNAPAVNPTIVPKGTTTALKAPAGNNFIGILNPGDSDISGKPVHQAVAGSFEQGSLFQMTVFANRGRLAGASPPVFDSAPSEVLVTFFGWGAGAPASNCNSHLPSGPLMGSGPPRRLSSSLTRISSISRSQLLT